MTTIGTPKLDPINIGTEAKPPFAVAPDPTLLFKRRAGRFTTLAAGHDLAPYLSFAAAIANLQHEAAAAPDGLQPRLPDAERLSQAKAAAMPPLAGLRASDDPAFGAALARMTGAITAAPAGVYPAEAVAAARLLPGLEAATIEAATAAIFTGEASPLALAEAVLLAAVLQVHFSRLAASLDAGTLQPVADGVCPACGAAPVASAVVGWPSAPNTRFCTCSMCATQWNVVRVKCVVCSSTGGIGYYAIEGQSENVKGETCEACRSYVKIFYEVNDASLEPEADDTASLALDLKLAEDGWTRRGSNLFLMGYGGGARRNAGDGSTGEASVDGSEQ